jgi:hypothetical protein
MRRNNERLWLGRMDKNFRRNRTGEAISMACASDAEGGEHELEVVNEESVTAKEYETTHRGEECLILHKLA